MKYITKIFAIICIIVLLDCIIEPNVSYAGMKMSDLQGKASKFIGQGKQNKIDGNSIFTDLRDIGSIMTTVGVGILVLVATYMGIKYMTSPPEAQAKLKQQLIGLFVAAIVVMGASGIWALVVKILQEV